MASNTDYLPDEITYGFVADRVLLAVGDTRRDLDRHPDGVPAQGTVRFSPQRTILYTQQRPATVLPQDIECTIYHRDHPVAVEHGYEPELVGKLVDPAGHVGNVALIVGWYDVVYRLSTGTAQRFRFQVKPEHTADNPLWLPEVAPLQPTPSERFVVNEQVYNDTKTARDEAEQFRDTTRTYRNETETYRDQAEGYRNEAGQSATTAAEILSDVQDLGITVDTSVGTRVYVGNTMIHGDTGVRDVTNLINSEVAVLEGISVPRATLTRVNNTVYFSIRMTVAPGLIGSERSTALYLMDGAVPAGFRENPVSYGVLYSGRLTSASHNFRDDATVHLYNASGAGYLDLRATQGRWQSGDSFNFSTQWQSRDPWPASLPGTPF